MLSKQEEGGTGQYILYIVENYSQIREQMEPRGEPHAYPPPPKNAA